MGDEGRRGRCAGGRDKFVTNLMGKVEHIDVCGANKWVRQGQKIVTLTTGSTRVDLLSPAIRNVLRASTRLRIVFSFQTSAHGHTKNSRGNFQLLFNCSLHTLFYTLVEFWDISLDDKRMVGYLYFHASS